MRILIYEKGWGPNNNVFFIQCKIASFWFWFRKRHSRYITVYVYSNKIFFNLIPTFLLSSTYVHVLVKFPELVHVQYKGILVVVFFKILLIHVYACTNVIMTGRIHVRKSVGKEKLYVTNTFERWVILNCTC